MPANTYSLIYNGTSNYGFGNQNNWSFPITNSYTVEAWFKPSSLAATIHFIHKGDRYQTNSGWYIARDNALLRFGYRNASVSYEGTVDFATYMAVGYWTHLCLTFDYPTRVLRLYVNGALVHTTATLAVAPGDYTPQPFRMAANNPENAERYAGLADEVRVWSVCRTATQIGNFYNKQALGGEPGLYALYRLNNMNPNWNERSGAGGLPSLEFFGGSFAWSADVSPTTPATYADAVRDDSPVGYWRLGDLAGTAVLDSSGNNRNGTAVGVTFGQPGGMVGDADTSGLFSVAASSVITVPHDNAFNFTGDHTLEGWVKLTSWSNHTLLICKCVNGGETNDNYQLQITPSGYLQYAQYNASAQQVLNSTAAGAVVGQVPLNIWTHVAFTKAGATGNFYINGIPCGTGALTTTGVTTSTNALYLGTREDRYSYAEGLIDELAIYNTALSAYRLAFHHARGRGRYAAEVVTDNPIGYWRLNELAAGPAAGFLLDYSGLGNRCGVVGAGVTRERFSATYGVDADWSTYFGGPGVYFDGTAMSVTVGISDRVTIEAWVLNSGPWAGGHEFLGWFGTSGNYLSIINGMPHFSLMTGASVQRMLNTGVYVPADAWIHVVGTWDGAYMGLYVNGVLMNSAPQPGPMNGGTYVRLGDYDGSLGLNGYLDEVAVYNSALSAARVQAHYLAAKATMAQRWDGTKWVPALVRRWDGAAWVGAGVAKNTGGWT